MKTQNDIVALALRRLGVTAEDDTPTADQQANGSAALASIFAELSLEAVPDWTLAGGIPDAAAPALSELLAAEIAPNFSRQPPVSRARAYLRLIATIRPDDRPGVEADPSAGYY
jgi:hypothetical protein